MTRRGVIGAGALAGAGAALGGMLAPPRAQALPGGVADQTIPFYGPHQSGIASIAQEYLHFAAFDLLEGASASDLRSLLERWSALAASLTRGEPRVPAPQPAGTAPADTGEAIGLGPSRLTLTFGLGPSLFSSARSGRLGLSGRRPRELRRLPPFAGERLNPKLSDGDVCVQACADDPQVAFHAVHELARAAGGLAAMRWSQQGFGRTSATTRAQGSTRNLMGFKDGTANLRAEDTTALERFVWVAQEGPRWMAGGTYLILRRIRMLFEGWDASSLETQQRTIGRVKLSGAPLGGARESDPVELQARDAQGRLVIPEHAHIRVASPQSNAGEAILRRGYSYSEGVDQSDGRLDAGLFFICFQRSPTRQFVPLQRQLAAYDALTSFTSHTASAIFACPPGTLPGGFVGELLFD